MLMFGKKNKTTTIVKVANPATCNERPRKYLKGLTKVYAVTFSRTALLAFIKELMCSRTMC